MSEVDKARAYIAWLDNPARDDKEWVPQDILPSRIASARLLIAQADLLAMLRAENDERGTRIDELRAALTKAVDDLSDCDRRGDWKDEIAELRKLVTP